MSFIYDDVQLVEILLSCLSEQVMGAPGAKVDLSGVMQIHSETGLGLRTIKRIVGMERAPVGYLPYHGTRDVLAKYIGFQDWAHFVRAQLAERQVTPQDLMDSGSQSVPNSMDRPALPALPGDIRYPNMPFRYLDWFRRDDARIFYGRTAAISELLEYLEDPLGDEVVLVYGQSGVGKSSFLHAGVLPRLEGKQSTLFLRREAGGNLSALLTAALTEFGSSGGILVIDQLDAIFSGGLEDEMLELVEFGATLKRVLSERGLRVLLSFRKEYYAEVDTVLTRSGIRFKRFFLQSLTLPEIEDAIIGITKDKGAMEKYQLGIDPVVPEKLLELLGSDRESHVAPALQVVLTKLWLKATHLGAWPPVFTDALLTSHIQPGAHFLGDFIDEGLAALGDRWPIAMHRGLFLDLLGYYVSEIGTARERTQEDVMGHYPHIPEIMVYVQAMNECRLLSDPAQVGKGVLRLAHDSLGPLILQRVSQSMRPGQVASRLLGSRAQIGGEGYQRLWDEVELHLINEGRYGMRGWTVEEETMILSSHDAQTAKAKARRRRNLFRVTGIVLALIVVAVVIGFLQRLQRSGVENQSLFALRQARTILAEPNGDIGEAMDWYQQVLELGIYSDSVAKDLLEELPRQILSHTVNELEGIWEVYQKADASKEDAKAFAGHFAYINWLGGKYERAANLLGTQLASEMSSPRQLVRNYLKGELGQEFLDSLDHMYLPSPIFVDPSKVANVASDSLRSFWLARTEVTCRQFVAWQNASQNLQDELISYSTESSQFDFVGNCLRLRKETSPNAPAIVRWLEADAYCKWFGWRLPSFAEWRLAAYAGESTSYPGGNDLSRLACHNLGFGSMVRICDVASLQPNRLGLYDMAGNVAEWLSDHVSRPDISIFQRGCIGGSFRNTIADGVMGIHAEPIYLTEDYLLDVGIRPVLSTPIGH